MRGNNIKNCPLKRNKYETPVHYQDMWIGLSGGGEIDRVCPSACVVCVFVIHVDRQRDGDKRYNLHFYTFVISA
jgi:hypothetical protein